jgi:hypothetical protein
MQNNRIDVLIKYAFYDASLREAALNRIISRLKRVPDKLAFAYFAAILSQPLAELAAARDFEKIIPSSRIFREVKELSQRTDTTRQRCLPPR